MIEETTPSEAIKKATLLKNDLYNFGMLAILIVGLFIAMVRMISFYVFGILSLIIFLVRLGFLLKGQRQKFDLLNLQLNIIVIGAALMGILFADLEIIAVYIMIGMQGFQTLSTIYIGRIRKRSN